MGTGIAVSNVNTIEVINSTSFCMITYATNSAALHLFTVDGRTITQQGQISVTGGNVASGGSLASNPAKMSNNSVLVVNERSGEAQYFAEEYIISGNTFVRGARIGTLARDSNLITSLVSVNGGAGRFVMIVRNLSDNNFAAHAIGFPTARSINMGNNGGTQFSVPRMYGSLRFASADFKPMAVSRVAADSIEMRVIDVNRDTGVMTFGAAQRVPKISHAPDVTISRNGRLMFTGTGSRNGVSEVILTEAQISGTSLSLTEEYQPFRNTLFGSGTLNNGLMVENPNNSGEILLVQHGASASGAAHFWFGFRSDSHDSHNIAGIALENGANGRVRVQVSGKLVPGLWSGLKRGSYYAAGTNGGLLENGGASRGIVGMAASAGDFIFYGANNIR
jgi:hypothetical protein